MNPARVDVFTSTGKYSLHVHPSGSWELTFKKIDELEIEAAVGSVGKDQCLVQQNRVGADCPIEDLEKIARILQSIVTLKQGG